MSGDRFDGTACLACGVVRDLFVVRYWQPPHPGWSRNPAGYHYARARCLDAAACEARVAKCQHRSRTRASLLILEEPAAAGAPLGTCRWCAAELTGLNGARRNYCYPDREGRDCVAAWRASRTWDARTALEHRGDPVCVDCGSDGPWEADHQAPLEDGGAHTLENLCRRCVPCHKAKTAAENSVRARRRRAIDEAQAMVDAGQVSLLEATYIVDLLAEEEAA